MSRRVPLECSCRSPRFVMYTLDFVTNAPCADLRLLLPPLLRSPRDLLLRAKAYSVVFRTGACSSACCFLESRTAA